MQPIRSADLVCRIITGGAKVFMAWLSRYRDGFPQSIGLSATWDDSLLNRVADVISTEFRAKFNDYQKKGDHGVFKGLTVWSPNIIYSAIRDGKGTGNIREDPYLASRMGVAYVKGMQGDDPKYLKTISTPKHYAVHSGPNLSVIISMQ